jgi:hypothetical protein
MRPLHKRQNARDTSHSLTASWRGPGAAGGEPGTARLPAAWRSASTVPRVRQSCGRPPETRMNHIHTRVHALVHNMTADREGSTTTLAHMRGACMNAGIDDSHQPRHVQSCTRPPVCTSWRLNTAKVRTSDDGRDAWASHLGRDGSGVLAKEPALQAANNSFATIYPRNQRSGTSTQSN